MLSIMMFLSAVHNPKLPSQKMKIRPQRDSNSQSSDSKSDALSVCHASVGRFSNCVDLKCSRCRCFPA